MVSVLHKSHDVGEDREVVRFGRSQRIRLEEREDTIGQVSTTADAVPVHVFRVVVAPAIAADRTTPEVLLEQVQNLHTASSLTDRELRLDLPTVSARLIPEDRNAEAAFAVDEADDPLCSYWPFLLIDRTGRIVTSNVTHPTERV